MRVVSSLVALMVIVAACADIDQDAVVVNPTYVRAAETLCPVMWGWQRSVGAAMNDMSGKAKDEPDPDTRRELYRQAAARIRELNAQLAATVLSFDETAPLDRIIPDVRLGIDTSTALLEAYDAIIEERYQADPDPTYGEVVPALFLNVEKVIDVAKPEMATYDDPELIEAFITVPQCQVGVKDASDGTARYIP